MSTFAIVLLIVVLGMCVIPMVFMHARNKPETKNDNNDAREKDDASSRVHRKKM